MKSLSTYINECAAHLHSIIMEGTNILDIPSTPRDFWNWAETSKKIDAIKKILSDALVQELYKESEKQRGSRKLPFVVNYRGSKVFVCRHWVYDYLKKSKDKSFDPSKTVSGVYAGLHDTMFNDDLTKASRADRGLAQEKKDIADIIYFCKIASEFAGDDKAKRAEMYKLLKEKDLSRFIEMYEKGTFDTIISHFTKESSLDPDDWSPYISLSGSTNTHRNDEGELYDEEFTMGKMDVDEVLKKSGSIIADITIYKNPGRSSNEFEDTYISCKMKSSQLSGVSARNAMESNKAFIEGMTPNDKGGYPTFEELKPSLTSFINFWNNFGVDAKDIYNHYQAIEKGENPQFTLTNQLNYDEEVLGAFVRKLVGGNYWYLKPTECRWVPKTTRGLKFNVENITISPGSARTIKIIGKINNKLPCNLTLRTDNKNVRFPYRIFPEVDVSSLIEMCSVPDEKANPEK